MTTTTTAAHYYYTSEGMFCADDFDAFFTASDKRALAFIAPVARPNFDTEDECVYCRNRVNSMTYQELIELVTTTEVTAANGEYLFMASAQIIKLEWEEELRERNTDS